MPSSVPAPYHSPGPANPGAAAQSSSGSTSLGTAFHDLLDIVNPLQHLPVIGTIYRAITGDKIGKFEKVAGDGLYGGLWGAVSSVADLAFEAVTGKDFGDTVLALFKSDGAKPSAVAQNMIPAPAPAAASAPGADVVALSSALQQKGVDNDIAQRALFAYRRSMGLSDPSLAVN
jgi:hypothetical protein